MLGYTRPVISLNGTTTSSEPQPVEAPVTTTSSTPPLASPTRKDPVAEWPERKDAISSAAQGEHPWRAAFSASRPRGTSLASRVQRICNLSRALLRRGQRSQDSTLGEHGTGVLTQYQDISDS